MRNCKKNFANPSSILFLFLAALPVGNIIAGFDNLGKETPFTLPDCIPNAETVVVDSIPELIDAVTDPARNVICVEPGSYGTIRLDEPGQEFRPKFLIPNHPTGQALPAPWDLPQNQRVVFDGGIEFGSEYWYVTGVAVMSDKPKAVLFDSGSFGNLIDNTLVEGLSERLPTGTGSQAMIRMAELSDYNNIQNSVLRNPPRIPFLDSHCIGISNSQYNTIINNQIYDCPGDGIQLLWDPESGVAWDNRGTKIINNEMYVSPRLYANCEDASEDANLNGTGECSCAENAMDIKIVSMEPIRTAQDQVEILDNVLYGFRQTHQSCGGTGDDGSPAIYLHHGFTSNVTISGNLIFESDTGIQLFDAGYGGPNKIQVFNNVLYNIRTKGSLQINGGEKNKFIQNTLILTLSNENDRKSIRVTNTVGKTIIAHNLTISEFIEFRGFMDADHPDPDAIVFRRNAFMVMASPVRNATTATMEIELPFESLGGYDPYCVTIERHTGGSLICIPYVAPRVTASVVDILTRAQLSYPTDFFGNPRPLPRDLGAVEYQYP